VAVQILRGDCRNVLKTLPDESVHCVVTSPPYWGLRDYGVADAIGLEPSVDEHVAALVGVFREVRRVLRKDGVLWMNYGDAYAAGHGGSTTEGNYTPKVSTLRPSAMKERVDVDVGGWGKTDASLRLVRAGIKAKDLIGLPWRTALALQADGWYLRSDVIWSKPNPMPESVTDRPTRSHEYIFLLTRSARYHYDIDAIREPQESLGARHEGKSGYRDDHPSKGGIKKRTLHPLGRNVRSVWSFPTEAFPESHFATFPAALAERCILAGCPAGGVVLDPFGGAGTTGMVADRLQRDAILIELSPIYADMAERRINRDGGLFATVESAHAQ